MEFKGSKTETNLNQAFSTECCAHTKYLLYAAQARKDGYEQMAEFFEETARNEREHAELWLKTLRGGAIGKTKQNLGDASNDEHREWSELYSEYARAAREEGFEPLARLFEQVGEVEKRHEARYRQMLTNLTDGWVFRREGETEWQCRACGHIERGSAAPTVCPVCSHAQGWFEVKNVFF